ncbi:MAG: fused MFS/spermidine synthase [Acidobacteria bacterium]|nr:fused MFS/spermidine synthase [Acidobacteriota bacterium]
MRSTLFLTVFLSGAAVLVLDILGTRFLSPYFGANLYVWSALISVTLLALALGCWLGGRLPDARGSPLLLDQIVVAAALLVAVGH